MKCPFCNFKDKEVLLYTDKFCYAIVSKNPINNYHVLVIPKKHYCHFTDLPDALASRIFLVAKKLSRAVRKACTCDAVTHWSDDDIYQKGYNQVAHYKFHIIPRFLTKDKIKIDWNRGRNPGIKTRAKFAKEIKKCIGRG